MDVIKAIAELRAELARIDAAVLRLERLKRAEPARTRVWSGAARKAAAERMKRYWAQRKSNSEKAGGDSR